jgi:mannosyltransferase OCH1-like enzyme
MKKILTLIFGLSVIFGMPHLIAKPVSFDASMKRSKNFKKKICYRDDAWSHLRSLYDAYREKEFSPNAPYRIPKIIHCIWLGSPLPERCKTMIATWKKFHPTWTIRIWTDADVPSFQMKNKRAFDRAKNYGEKSDIWRYEILLRHGGLYIDTDFECIKPFDDLHKQCNFFAGIAYTRPAILYNGLIGSIPNHPILQKCIENIHPSTGDNNSDRIMEETGPLFFSRIFFSMKESCKKDVVGFPITYFYAYPNTLRLQNTAPNKIKKKWIEDESYAIHYWATSWVKNDAKK